MVILIGGVSHGGKTLMAQTLLEKYHITYLSADHLKMGLVRGTDCDFTPVSDDALITARLWPILRAIAMTNIENRQNIIIEGCYIPPDAAADFPEGYREKIISLYLLFSEEYAEKCFLSQILPKSGVVENRLRDDAEKAELAADSRRLKEKLDKTGGKYFEIRQNYGEEIKAAYAWLDEKICSQLSS